MTSTSISDTTNAALLRDTSTHYQKDQDQKDVLLKLNNAAVSLLARGLRKEAVVTFQEALKVLQSTNHEDPAVALERALQRTNTELCGTTTCCPRDDDYLLVLSSQYNPADAYKLVLERSPDASVCLIMEADMDVHLVKAMLVYNYGVTHCCVAVHNMQNPAMAKLGTLCFQIYQYAETLLAASDSSEFLLFSLLLTRKLEHLSDHLGLPINKHYQESLDTIVAAITQLAS